MKKILLLSDMPPTNSYTGGIVLEQLFRNLPFDAYCCYSAISRSVYPVISDNFKGMELKLDRKPVEYVGLPRIRLRKLRPIFKCIGFFYELYSAHKAKKLQMRILEYCKDKDIGLVFCVLQGQTMHRLAEPVAKALGVKLIVMVWDSLDWWLKNHNTDPITTYLLHKQLAKTMQYATLCATASQGMSDHYSKLYNVECIPLIYSVPEQSILPPSAAIKDKKRFILGFAGQLYAYSTLMALITLLEHVGWVVDGVAIEIALLGEGHEHIAKRYKHIQYLGWRNQETLLPTLAEFDALYLPYMFEARFKTEMQTSFPSKLVTYFAAGKPVFFHGPSYSSAYTIIKQYNAGMACNVLEKAAIYNALARLIKDDELRQTYVKNAHALLLERFTLSSQRKLFFEAIGSCEVALDIVKKAA